MKTPHLFTSFVLILSFNTIALAGDSVVRSRKAASTELNDFRTAYAVEKIGAKGHDNFALEACEAESEALCGGGRTSCSVIKDQAFVIKDRAFVIKDQLAYSSEMGGMKQYGYPVNAFAVEKFSYRSPALAKSLVDGDVTKDSVAAKSFPLVAPVPVVEPKPAASGASGQWPALERIVRNQELAEGGAYWAPGSNGAEGGTYHGELPVDRFAKSFPATGKALLGIGRQMTDGSIAAGGGRVLAISEGDSAILLENGIKATVVGSIVAGLSVLMKAVCPASIMMMSAPAGEKLQASVDSDESEEWGVRCEFVRDRQFACEGPELGDLSLTVDLDSRNPEVRLN